MTTNDILDHHLKCFGTRDLEGILGDYAPDAVMFCPDGIRKGPDARKDFFVKLLAEFSKPGASMSMQQTFVEGDYAYIVWTAESAGNKYLMATDTFVIRDGKIVAQSFAAKVESK